MKTIGIVMIAALMLVSAVSATTTTLSESEIAMAYYDVRDVEFCLSGANGQQNIDVVIDPVCRDLDNNYGCAAGDDYDIGDLFSVTPSQSTMNDGDCIMLTLETTIEDEADGGKFFYTVNGQVGGTTIGSETGTVLVPEFGVVAALVALAGAGLFVYKRRN